MFIYIFYIHWPGLRVQSFLFSLKDYCFIIVKLTGLCHFYALSGLSNTVYYYDPSTSSSSIKGNGSLIGLGNHSSRPRSLCITNTSLLNDAENKTLNELKAWSHLLMDCVKKTFKYVEAHQGNPRFKGWLIVEIQYLKSVQATTLHLA